LTVARGGDAQVADPAFLLQLLEDAELGGDVGQVVDLDEVYSRDPELLERSLDLCPCGRGVRRLRSSAHHVHLGGPEDLVRDPEGVRDVARHLLRGTVTRRRIEDAGAVVHHGPDDLGQGIQLFAARQLRERGGAAQADHRQHLAR
jgi:hypothetical protein